MTLEDLFDGFLSTYLAGRKANTVRQHSDNIAKTIAPILGGREVESIVATDAVAVANFGDERGISQGRASVLTLRLLMRYARERGAKLSCCADEMRVPPAKRLHDLEVLTPADVETIRDALDDCKDRTSKHCPKANKAQHVFAVARTKCMFEFLLHTGLRLSEALSVDRDQVDFGTCEMRVLDEKSDRYNSSRKWKTVYIHGSEPALREWLAMRTDSNPALFVSWGGDRLSFASAQSNLKRIKKAVGLKKNLTHRIFRATHVTTLLRSGMDPKEVQMLVGHATLQMTLQYYDWVDREKLKPMHAAVMSSAFDGNRKPERPESPGHPVRFPEIRRPCTIGHV